MSVQEGRMVLDETNLWIETSRMALNGGVRRLDGPWEQLVDAGRLLSLEGEAFEKAVRAANIGSDNELSSFVSQLGISASREAILDVLKVREEYSQYS